ncbi:hypothetical protein BaRGS_00027912, partial [Batillaria attramentaria]
LGATGDKCPKQEGNESGSGQTLKFKMAEKEGGGKLEKTKDENTQIVAEPVHNLLSDAALFSFGAVCALGLRKLFAEEWHKEFNKETLSIILNGLEQPKQVQESVQAIFEGQGSEDSDPFVKMLREETALKADASALLSELIGFAISQGNYDARMRVLVKHVAWRLHVGPDSVDKLECALAETLSTEKYEMSQEEKDEQQKKAKRRLTGGLAAPLVAAGAGVIIGGAGAAALGSVAGVAIIGSLFGVAGAGLTGYKMKRRVGAIEEFEFEPLICGGPLQLQTVQRQLHITITVTGWLDSKMPDFKQPWQNLAASQEQYSLRWESRFLKELGQALDYIFNSAVSIATNEALKYTVLSALMAAIAWPSALLSVSKVIDNPWSVALQRAVATGRQLAEVLLTREQGKRPVTLIGYSLGGRVIFYCLEEMAKRKGCEGIIEDVVILGAPVPGNDKAWDTFSRVVAGRIVNGYCRGDWLLKFLYRTSSVQLHIAGLAPVPWKNRRMHNIDLSDVVSGHMDYMRKLDTILRVIGIRVREGVKAKSSPARSPLGSPLDISNRKTKSSTSTASSPSDTSSSPDSESAATGKVDPKNADGSAGDFVSAGMSEDHFSTSGTNATAGPQTAPASTQLTKAEGDAVGENCGTEKNGQVDAQSKQLSSNEKHLKNDDDHTSDPYVGTEAVGSQQPPQKPTSLGILKTSGGKIKSLFTKKAHAEENSDGKGHVTGQSSAGKDDAGPGTRESSVGKNESEGSGDSYTSSEPCSPDTENQV